MLATVHEGYRASLFILFCRFRFNTFAPQIIGFASKLRRLLDLTDFRYGWVQLHPSCAWEANTDAEPVFRHVLLGRRLDNHLSYLSYATSRIGLGLYKLVTLSWCDLVFLLTLFDCDFSYRLDLVLLFLTE